MIDFAGLSRSLEPLLAFPKLKSTNFPSEKGDIEVSAIETASSDSKSNTNLESSDNTPEDFNAEYLRLQLSIYRVALFITAFAVLLSAIFLDSRSAVSLLVGAFSGIFYLRLLARGIGKLGKTSMSVTKVQLLVPVLLFFLVSRLPQLELWPSLVGFLLYKPSLIVQFLLEHSAKAGNLQK
ncbi:ATP synthase subunit I [Prochlorococcus sp. MIT 1223]|uniref:ATP synthase subunit I n=1 Tax=Prochlorococcus sp. MIT 1223 TaxID=3096217 RepID=UPI002A75E637|nr:ATP synthase subunit I [Prochlorococcus sp. MIT 1223]